MIKQFSSKLIGIHDKWISAFSRLGIANPEELERDSFVHIKKFENSRVVIGLSGPGAVGKNALAASLGYPRIINTTTRASRSNEVEGVHYYFTTEDEFAKAKSSGEFLTTTDRPGRGNYGITKQAVSDAFTKSQFLIAEENPKTLAEIGTRIKDLGAEFILVYILPPYPVAMHLMARLAVRSIESGEDFGQVIESTLGDRQIEEFISTDAIRKSGTPLVYVVNDDIARAGARIKNIF